MSGLGRVLTESMLQSIIYESSRTPPCWGAPGSSEKDLLLPSWAAGTLLTLGKVVQHLGLLATDKSPCFRFVLAFACPVSVVRGQFKEPPAPALVSSPSSSQPGRLFPGTPWSREGRPPFVSFHLGVLLPWKKSWILWMRFCFTVCFQLLNWISKVFYVFFLFWKVMNWAQYKSPVNKEENWRMTVPFMPLST